MKGEAIRAEHRPVRSRPSQDFGKGRTCQGQNCATVLSRYNPGDFCRSCSLPERKLMSTTGDLSYENSVKMLQGQEDVNPLEAYNWQGNRG